MRDGRLHRLLSRHRLASALLRQMAKHVFFRDSAGGPVPLICRRSRLLSLAMRRTSGDERTPSVLTAAISGIASFCAAVAAATAAARQGQPALWWTPSVTDGAGCSGSLAGGRTRAPNYANDGVDLDGGAFLDLDLGQHAGSGSGISASTLSVESRTAAHPFSGASDFLEPLGDRSLENRLAHLRA